METTEYALRKNSVIKRTGKKTSACAGVFFIVWETSFPYDKNAPRGSHCGGMVECRLRDPPQAENPASQDSFLSYGKLRFHTIINALRGCALGGSRRAVSTVLYPLVCHISAEQSVTHLSRAPSTPEAPDTTLLSITSGSVYERCTISATARFCECSLQSARCSTARQTAARYTPRAAPMAEA